MNQVSLKFNFQWDAPEEGEEYWSVIAQIWQTTTYPNSSIVLLIGQDGNVGLGYSSPWGDNNSRITSNDPTLVSGHEYQFRIVAGVDYAWVVLQDLTAETPAAVIYKWKTPGMDYPVPYVEFHYNSGNETYGRFGYKNVEMWAKTRLDWLPAGA